MSSAPNENVGPRIHRTTGDDMKHEIASSAAYGARCTCGHIERSALGRMVALTQLMEHLEASGTDTQEEK